jgi:hypothetical protein
MEMGWTQKWNGHRTVDKEMEEAKEWKKHGNGMDTEIEWTQK